MIFCFIPPPPFYEQWHRQTNNYNHSVMKLMKQGQQNLNVSKFIWAWWIDGKTYMVFCESLPRKSWFTQTLFDLVLKRFLEYLITTGWSGTTLTFEIEFFVKLVNSWLTADWCHKQFYLEGCGVLNTHLNTMNLLQTRNNLLIQR